MTLIEFMWLLSIALVIHYTSKATDWITDSLLSSPSSPKTKRIKRKQQTREKKVGDNEAKQRNRVQLKEEEDRLLIENLMEQTTPITALVGDSHRVCARFMLAQQRHNNPKLRIPVELTKIIHQYSDYNEIRTLFQILTSPKDRKEILGFTSYVQMHLYLPSRADKIAHLKKGLKTRLLPSLEYDPESDNESDSEDVWQDHVNTIGFGDQDVFIHRLGFQSNLPNGSAISFNWDALTQLTQLEELTITNLDMSISMDDIRKLPKSLRVLSIRGNVWSDPSGDVDLGLLPLGLEVFEADSCRGMNGILGLNAPYSNLVKLDLRDTALQPRLCSEADLPRSLEEFGAPPGFEYSAICKVMKEKDVNVRL